MAKFKPDPVFSTEPLQVGYLLSKIQGGEIGIPNFQRDFVWEPRRVAELLRTVMSRYPAGSLLFLANDGDPQLEPRNIEGAPELGKAVPSALVLDGQQRLTSLYQAQTGSGDELFLLNLNAFIDGDLSAARDSAMVDWEGAIEWRDKRAKNQGKILEVRSQDWQFDNLRIPVSLLSDGHGVDDWIDAYLETRVDSRHRKAAKETLRDVRDIYLDVLETYTFPVVQLPSTTSIEAVCTVFETLNRTGKPLGAFELLTARFFPKKVNLRELWSEALTDYPLLVLFGVDPYSVLQAVSLMKRDSAQRTDVLGKLEAVDVEDYWADAVSGFNDVLQMLEESCGVLSPRFLPYSMLLVPMAAVWSRLNKLKNLEKGPALERLKQYFWCSVFSLNFDQGANSQAGADYKRLKEWLFDPALPAPEAITFGKIGRSLVEGSTIRKKALYAGVLALTLREGAKDFHSAQVMTPKKIAAEGIDSHHVFPRAYLAKGRHKDQSELIVNRVLIDPQTNKAIGKRAPGNYLKDMRATYKDDVDLILESHLIDPMTLDANDYPAFVRDRSQRILGSIAAVTGFTVVKGE